MKITKEEFHLWKELDITKGLYDSLKEFKDRVEQNMLNGDLIMQKDSSVQLARLVGIREGLDLVLNMSIEEVTSDEESESSGI